MPAIPPFQPRADIQGPVQPRISGQVIEDVGRAADRVQAATRAIADTLRENAETEGRIQLTERLGRLRGELENDPDPANIRRRWDTEGQAIVREVSGGIGGLLRGGVSDYGRLALAQEGRGVEALIGRRVTEQTVATVTQRGQQLAQQAANPQMRDAALAEWETVLSQAARTLPADRLEAMRQRFNGEIARGEIMQIGLRNPGEAARLLADPNGRFSTLLDADERLRLSTTFRSQAQADAARGEAAAGRRAHAAAAALAATNQAIENGYIPTNLAGLQATVRGTPYEEPLRIMLQNSRERLAFAALPAAEQRQVLETAAGGIASSPQPDMALRHAQGLATIAQNQATARARDGLGQAQREGFIGTLPPINLADPASFNARIEAAQAYSVHTGMPIPALTQAESQQVAQTFVNAPEGEQWRALQTVMGINDPAVRAATIRQIETARGDAGRMPPGSLLRIWEMSQANPVAGRAALSALSADTDNRFRQIHEGPELRQAMATAAATGILGARQAQSGLTGFGAYSTEANRDMEFIQRTAAHRMLGGETPAVAVQRATEQLYQGRAALNDPRLAVVVYRSADAPPQALRDGFTRLRQSLADAAPADQRAAIMQGTWVNIGRPEENRYALAVPGAGGQRVVPPLPGAQTDLNGVLRAARAVQAETRTDTPEAQARVSAERARQLGTGGGGGFTPPTGAPAAAPLGGSTRRRPTTPPQMQ